MKITIDVDCTPEEARRFLGLPDVAPMQEQLIRQMHEQMSANLAAMDPETMIKTWLPMGLQGLEQMQRVFWESMSSAGQGTGGKSDKPE
ncbi:MAG: DUF6489 family protein [Alphaproteobacteria bacterium]|nr:DUF6489 family protein [Alphaproteobacteria bacterium]